MKALQRSLSYAPVAVALFALACEWAGLPLRLALRNTMRAGVPDEVAPKYAACSDEMLAREMTIVVTVKDACSQAPGFIEGLAKFAPASVHLIYSFPNFQSCAQIDLAKPVGRWDRVTMLPLPLRSSPMQGWLDAVPHIETEYALLLHNDGYALDDFFGCELLQALKARQPGAPLAPNTTDGARYVAAAPMLFESKHDGSLAAHATQENLRLVRARDGVETVRHDHSIARALNRGDDIAEGEQTSFIEDHGFMLRTEVISTVIDPRASFTLEYIDMIMTLYARAWKVLFVPTARLEFRITEFSWRDIPYFMYKRSEATCHGTRDYLAAKWRAHFPNTGFWTYIKYTIVEQHVYRPAELARLAWKDTAALAFGFMQMAGYNRYVVHDAAGDAAGGERVDFVTVLERLDAGWTPPGKGAVTAERKLNRPEARNAARARPPPPAIPPPARRRGCRFS